MLATGSDSPLPWGRTQIVFDVMDTVVKDPFLEVTPGFFGLSKEELFKCKNSSAWFAFERGDIDEAQLRATYFKDGREFDLAGLKRAMMGAYRFVDGMPELLADMRSAGHQLHCFSNYPEWYKMVEEKLRLEADHGLQWTCVSCDTGLRKPEPPAYLCLLRMLGVGRQAGAAPVLLIDDRLENCEAAEAVGIRSLHFTGDVRELRAELGGLLSPRGALPPEAQTR